MYVLSEGRVIIFGIMARKSTFYEAGFLSELKLTSQAGVIGPRALGATCPHFHRAGMTNTHRDSRYVHLGSKYVTQVITITRHELYQLSPFSGSREVVLCHIRGLAKHEPTTEKQFLLQVFFIPAKISLNDELWPGSVSGSQTSHFFKLLWLVLYQSNKNETRWDRHCLSKKL